MNITIRSTLRTTALLLGLWLAGAPVAAQDDDPLAERRRLAEERSFLHLAHPAPAATGPELASVLDLPVETVLEASVTGAAVATDTLPGLGVIGPTRGPSFAMLSTGRVGFVPEPGTDFAPDGPAGDRVVLTLLLEVPAGPSQLSFDFNFLSAEFPDFIGTQFNDSFFVELTDRLGTRTIAAASVNSSFFFPANATRAGGSGFDIFTPMPDGVDTSFGTGQPDAGLTDFQSASAPVESDGAVLLRFTIEDQGDGILDSAVLLDNLQVSSFEIVDANDPQFVSGGRVTSDPGRLSQGGETRRGVVADGVSRLLLRRAVSGPGQVRFCVLGDAPTDGGLATPGGDGRAGCVTVPVVTTSEGRRAFAIYRAPDELVRDGDASVTQREVRIESTRLPPGGGTVERAEAVVSIVRPPVVLVHGLWSFPATWAFPLATDPRFRIFPVDYEETNAARFAVNGRKVRDEIEKAVRLSEEQGFAATQADVVGHSMGGLLARLWIQSPGYRDDDNFHAGDVRKLITLDTPHTGSPLANLLVDLRETFAVGNLVSATACFIDKGIHTGCGKCAAPGATGCAVDDLSKGSAALQGIQATPVPAHAIVGKGGSDLVGDLGTIGSLTVPGPWGAFFRMLAFYGNLSQVFPGLQHDLVVGRDSQEGGMPAGAFTVFGNGDGVHVPIPLLAVGNTASSAYSQRVIALLDTPVAQGDFAQFPPPATLPSFLRTLPPLTAPPSGVVQGGLRLTLLGSSEVAPGDQVPFRVEPGPGQTIDSVLLVGQSAAEMDGIPPFELSLTIPDEAIGPLGVAAIGKNAAGDFFFSEQIVLQVTPPDTVESVAVIPSEVVLLGVSDTERLTVLGRYDDGVVRDVTAFDTDFLTVEPEIAVVDATGRVRAVAPGVTTVVAVHGDVQDSVTVTVLGEGSSGPCLPTDSQMCLNEGRFRVRVAWRDFQGNEGVGRVVPFGSDDSGLFWFFNAANWEMLVKVLDGCSINDRFWVFAAATTNVQYTLTVTDSVTGTETTYSNPLGQASPAITDVDALAVCDAGSLDAGDAAEAPALLSPASAPSPPDLGTTGSCTPTSTSLCLAEGRFRVEVLWRDFQGGQGPGRVVPFGSDDSGLFWFFNADNWEMLVKVLDGCSINDRFWVFAAATTNVQYLLRVTDTVTQEVREYSNPLGTASPAITDTSAFATCP